MKREAGDHRLTATIVTLSDKGAAGEREDRSGALLREILGDAGFEVLDHVILPDDAPGITGHLRNVIDKGMIELIVTTGGTGISPRDVTPEATLALGGRRLWGMEEEMRRVSTRKTPHGMLSRGVVIAVDGSLVVNLPGSPRAVRENLEAVLPAIPHALGLIRSRDVEYGGFDPGPSGS